MESDCQTEIIAIMCWYKGITEESCEMRQSKEWFKFLSLIFKCFSGLESMFI